MRSEYTVTLARFDGKRAVFELEDSQSLLVEKSELSPGAQVGDIFSLVIQPATEAKLEREELARTLLNEILHNDQIDKD